MRLRLTLPLASRGPLGQLLQERGATVEAESEMQQPDASGGGPVCSLTVQVEPGVFRDLHAFMQNEVKHQGRVEVLSFAVTVEGAEGDEYAAAVAAAAAAAAPARGGGAAAAEGGEEVGGSGAAGVSGQGVTRMVGAAARGRVGSAVNVGTEEAGPSVRVVYEKGPIEGLSEAFASRKERFVELDALQPGWLVELRERGDSVDAVFYSPEGQRVGPFAAARRQALQWKQKNG